MTSEQVTLLSHATEELRKLEDRQPLPLDTRNVAEKLRISSSTLNKAKNNNKLPYTCPYNGKIAEIHYSHHEKGKDYWIIWLKTVS